MQIKNSHNNYGIISILLHWIMALIIIGLFILGNYMVDLDYYDSYYHKAPWWHKSIGIIVFFLMIVRVLWKIINTSPKINSSNNFEIILVQFVHILLYILLLICCISGYLISTADDVGVSLFDWFDIPAVMSNGSQQSDIAGEIHEYSTLALIILAAFHMLAALKHHFINKNNTLTRMLSTKTK